MRTLQAHFITSVCDQSYTDSGKIKLHAVVASRLTLAIVAGKRVHSMLDSLAHFTEKNCPTRLYGVK